MFVVDGTVKIVPGAVSTDAGELRVNDQVQPAIIQTLMTDVGNFQVVFPAFAIDDIISGLQQAKEQVESGEGQDKKPDLYIPGSAKDVEDIAKVHEQVTKGKT